MRVHEQLYRLFLTGELLRQFRFGLDAATIHAEMVERYGRPICQRTVRRDLEFLELVGLVRRVALRPVRRRPAYRWLWDGEGSLLAESAKEPGREERAG